VNLTIANPIATPIMIEIEKPTINLHILIPMPTIKDESATKPNRDSATIAGEGSDTLGHIPNIKISCQIPKKAAKNSIMFAVSLMSIFVLILLECNSRKLLTFVNQIFSFILL
jgi:hypothetical protein